MAAIVVVSLDVAFLKCSGTSGFCCAETEAVISNSMIRLLIYFFMIGLWNMVVLWMSVFIVDDGKRLSRHFLLQVLEHDEQYRNDENAKQNARNHAACRTDAN